jgi:hypothetical protein
VFTCKPQLLHPRRKEPQVPTGQGAGGVAHSWSGSYGQITILDHTRTQTPPLGKPAYYRQLQRQRYCAFPREWRTILNGVVVTWLMKRGKASVRFEVFTAVIMKNVVFWYIKTQFVLHRRHITSPLQSSAS